MSKTDVVLVANSPGELSALVKPVAEELNKDRSKRIILVLTPCQYISGKEVEFAKTLKGIDLIISAAEYKKWALLNQKPKNLKFAEKGVVLFLGGDLAHAMLVARKLRYPAYAYLNERIAWKKFFKRFFVPDQKTFSKFTKQVNKDKLKIIGNLMVDSVSEIKKWDPEDNVVTFMPGSRRWEIDYMTPFYREVKELMEREEKKLKFQIVSSPFVKARPIEGMKTIGFDDIHNSEIVITIPGTNTAKIAARGIPMVVVFPLNHPEVIPMEGLADLIGKLPAVGKAFKRWVADTVNKKTEFFALPNQKAGREIVPEIRGTIEPLGVALKVLLLLKDKRSRKRMSEELMEAMGRPGAAKKIVEELNAALN
jgi:lipid-A-disaccharide synthase